MACIFASLGLGKNKKSSGFQSSGADLQAVMNTVLDGLIIIDESGTIQMFNPAATRIFGYQPNEVVGRNVNMLMPEPYHKEHDGYLKNYLTTNDAKVIGIGREVFGQRKDGNVFPMELGVNEMQVKDKRMFVGTVRDISQRKAADTERENMTTKLLESNTELERFAYIASHDMQEPIRMITSFGEILMTDYSQALDDTGKEYLRLVVDSGARMRAMVEDLLAYSRMGNEGANFAAFDGEKILGGALENIQELIKERKAEITPATLPMLHGNPVQIMRLLQNLVTNAIKYQPKNNRPLIHIDYEDRPAEWCLSVKDNGQGIDAQFIDQIFMPFRRLHTWEQVRGSGLGLPICKKIVENHGGKIWVKSTVGQGSTFYFTISKNVQKTLEAS